MTVYSNGALFCQFAIGFNADRMFSNVVETEAYKKNTIGVQVQTDQFSQDNGLSVTAIR